MTSTPSPVTGRRRRCVAGREAHERRGMIRFVLDPEARLVPDLAERLGGRGVWLSADRGAIDRAVKGHAFARTLRRPVAVPTDLGGTLEGLLRRRCLDEVGLARRSGAVAAGYDQVADALRTGRVGILLVARGASVDQVRRLGWLDPSVPSCALLDREELGRAFGRDELVYVAVAQGRLADRLTRDLERLAGVIGAAAPMADISAEPVVEEAAERSTSQGGGSMAERDAIVGVGPGEEPTRASCGNLGGEVLAARVAVAGAVVRRAALEAEPAAGDENEDDDAI